MDDSGNILIKRVSRCNVIAKGWNSPKEDFSAISSEIIKLNGKVEQDKPMKLFDMKKFAHNIERELRNSYPDRRKLENQCISIISFAEDATDILDLPCYVMIINIVAIDMLKSRIPMGGGGSRRVTLSRFASVFDEKGEENPYSPKTESSSSSSGSRGYEKKSLFSSKSSKSPPKLPPRDFVKRLTNSNTRPELPTPDYDDNDNEEEIYEKTSFRKSATISRRMGKLCHSAFNLSHKCLLIVATRLLTTFVLFTSHLEMSTCLHPLIVEINCLFFFFCLTR